MCHDHYGIIPLRIPLTNGIFGYHLSRQGCSSAYLGPCEVCQEFVPDVYFQTEYQWFEFSHKGEPFTGWTYKRDLFGHYECLIRQRKTLPKT